MIQAPSADQTGMYSDSAPKVKRVDSERAISWTQMSKVPVWSSTRE